MVAFGYFKSTVGGGYFFKEGVVEDVFQSLFGFAFEVERNSALFFNRFFAVFIDLDSEDIGIGCEIDVSVLAVERCYFSAVEFNVIWCDGVVETQGTRIAESAAETMFGFAFGECVESEILSAPLTTFSLKVRSLTAGFVVTV